MRHEHLHSLYCVRHRNSPIGHDSLRGSARKGPRLQPRRRPRAAPAGVVFSALEHKGQVRHSGEPYLVHPLEVAGHPRRHEAGRRVRRRRPAPRRRRGHPDDHRAHPRALRRRRRAHRRGRHQDQRHPVLSSEERQAENFRKMLLAMVDDIRVILVKLADRLHNMRTLQYMPEERRVAHRAGDAGHLRAHRQPPRHGQGQERARGAVVQVSRADGLRVAAARGSRPSAAATEGVIDELHRGDPHEARGRARCPVVAIDGRVKRLYSIWLEAAAPEDRARPGLRLRRGAHRHAVGEGLLRRARHHPPDLAPVPGRIKDFIAMPRPNGYQSLHTSVISDRGLPFEVQIRTEEMHRIAEEGIAAHWKYKEGRVGAGRDEQYFQWLRQLLEMAAGGARPAGVPEPTSRSTSIREEVYAFTPRGQVKVLPDGATPVDFAYADPHRRRPPVRRRPGQRPHGAAAHAAQERRHRRDRDHGRAHAQPRLAELRRRRRARATRSSTSSRPKRTRAPSTSAASCSRRRPSASTSAQGDARGRGPAARCGRARRREGRRPARRSSATASCRRAQVLDALVPAGAAEGKGARTTPWSRPSSACCGPAAPPPTASRSAAPTT